MTGTGEERHRARCGETRRERREGRYERNYTLEILAVILAGLDS